MIRKIDGKFVTDITATRSVKNVLSPSPNSTDERWGSSIQDQIDSITSSSISSSATEGKFLSSVKYKNVAGSEDKYELDKEETDFIGGIVYKSTEGTVNTTSKIAPQTAAVVNFVNSKINDLDKAEVGSDGSYIKKIKQEDGVITATPQGFDTSVSSTSKDNNAPTSKAVWNLIDSLDVSTNKTTNDNTYIKIISQTNGKISASTSSFDSSIDDNPSLITAPTTKAVKTYIDSKINDLDYNSVGESGSYIKTVSQTDGLLAATIEPFDTSVSSTSKDNNAPTSKAVWDLIAGLTHNETGGSTDKYIKIISQTNGKISATEGTFDGSIGDNASTITAPTTSAVKTYVDGKIDALDFTGAGTNGDVSGTTVAKYIRYIKQDDGVITAKGKEFDSEVKALSEHTTHNNVPSTKAVAQRFHDELDTTTLASSDSGYDANNPKVKGTFANWVRGQINVLDYSKPSGAKSKITSITQKNGQISVSYGNYANSLTTTEENAPQTKVVKSAIDSETQARASADSTLQSNIDSETQARASADSTLQSNIDSEAQARAGADANITATMDTTPAAYNSSDAVVNGSNGKPITNVDAEYGSESNGNTYKPLGSFAKWVYDLLHTEVNSIATALLEV